jgi:hypothetical protein
MSTGGLGALDELVVYYAWSCDSNQYVLSWGYNPNTTCADQSALGYFLDSQASAAFVPPSGDTGLLNV